MSWFLGLLQRIFGGDGNREEETPRRNSNRDNSPSYGTPSQSSVPTTTSATTYRVTREPSGAYTTKPSDAYATDRIHTSSYSYSWNSAPTKLPETPNISFVKPKATIHSSVVARPEASTRSTPDKSHDATAQKPKILGHSPFSTPDKSHGSAARKPNTLAPSPFLTDFSRKREAVYHATDKTSARTQPYELDSSSSQPWPSLTKLPASSSKKLPPTSTPPPPLASSSSRTPRSPPKPHRPSSKPFLSLAPSDPANPNSKMAYVLVEKDESPIYAIPEDFKDLIKNDVVPGILKRPLSPSTYKEYFEALLYAEDFYIEKWDEFGMKNVTLELEEASVYKRKGKCNKEIVDDEKDDKLFVTFELDSIPERRPFLLSRDFVFVLPSGTRAEPLQGLIYRVVKSNRVLVEFGEDFHAQHYEACEYDVTFSFNRVCLKRAHQAVATVSDPLFRNFLFPCPVPKNSLLTNQPQSIISNLDFHQISAVYHILSHQNAVPYLVEGPLARTKYVVCEAVLQLCRTSPSCRILICAPTNKGCDDITRSFKGKIPESSIFRANAAFRELDEVPEEILASCRYKTERECFSCPPIHELQRFDVISSTYMSSFRLHNEGIMAGHFSHIFLVDASSVIEPEAMVPLANLANESTAVTVTGERGVHSSWIRSPFAKRNGLLISYFERLWQSNLYDSLDSKVVTVLQGGKTQDCQFFREK